MAYIRFENVDKYYGNIQVLKNINLDVEKGELVTLLGLSGCGKSTLLRSLAGLEKISSGKIWLAGTDVTQLLPRDRKIGMVFQQYSLFPNMTAEQNIAFGLKVNGEPKATVQERVDEMVEIVGLTEQCKKYPSQMSGGQQQRVALARALVMRPNVLLLDEPLSAIDALLRRQLQLEIRRLHNKLNMTTIFVTHDQDEAMIMSDTIHLMNEGRIEQSGSPTQVYTHPATPFVVNFMGHYNSLSALQLKAAAGATVSCTSGAVRPEVVAVSDKAPDAADYMMEGTVEQCLLHGAILRYDVDCHGVAMQADVLYNGVEPYAKGTKVYLSFAKENLLLY